MIHVTGDCHSDFTRFSKKRGFNPSDGDIVLQLGDWGNPWEISGETSEEKYWLDWLEDKNVQFLFVNGNHCCFPRLYSYSEVGLYGGHAHQIRSNVFHLMNGYVFLIEDRSFFVMGGAASHDKQYRVENKSWWPQEIPSQEEFNRGIENLESVNYTVDYILSHEVDNRTLNILYPYGARSFSKVSDYLTDIKAQTNFKTHYAGHHHTNKFFPQTNTQILFEDIIPVGKFWYN